MRTKITILSAAALAAGLLSSNAQVFSANIVGYVNNALPKGFSLQANPFDATPDNTLTNLIQNVGGVYDGSFVYVWGGAAFTILQLDSSMSTGVANAADTAAVPAPVLAPGVSWYFNNQSGSAATNTYVGSVHFDNGSYPPGISTNALATGFNLVAAKIPIGGGITSSLQLTNTGGVLDGSFVYTPNFTGGLVTGYTISQFDSSQTTGFANAADTLPVAEPVIQVGSGAFINNQSGGPFNWVMTLP